MRATPTISTGVVVERLPDMRFRARLDDGRELTCVLPRVCALPRKVFSLLPAVGEEVRIEPSPYDAARGRLVLSARRNVRRIDRHLLRLVRDYQAAVRRAVEALREAGVEPPATRMAWTLARLTQLPRRGLYRFKKHGAGCEVVGPGLRVDFDFGERGEVDGFDAWRLGEFASGRLARYGFTRRKAIERAVEEAVAAGLVRVDGPLRYLAHEDHGLP